jgi:hypothetical protein
MQDALNQFRALLVQQKQEASKEKADKELLQSSLSLNDKEKLKLRERIDQYGRDIEQLKSMYMQIASEKAGLHREKEILMRKLERKKDKLSHTQEQLE